MDARFGVMSGKTPTVVSILNLKGGVGKTTVAALLARYASGSGGYNMTGQKNLDVLAVDLDPQANLSQALMGDIRYKEFHDKKKPSIVELFNGFMPASSTTPGPGTTNAPQIIQKISTTRYSGNLEIIPSRFDFSDNLIDSVKTDEKILAKFIGAEMSHKDLILIDCAPTESILTRAAYHASRYVIIPVRTEFLATIGFPMMEKSLKMFRDRNHGHKIDICGVLINRNRTSGAKMGPHHEEALADIQNHIKDHQWPLITYMAHSDGYPKWAKDPNATYLRNAKEEWPLIAQKILHAIKLNDMGESS